MKKTITIIILICILSLLCSITAGCSLFADKDKIAEGVTQITLTIYDGEKAEQIIVKYGEKANVTIREKKGYYLDGYYDKEEGGIKYFDSEGVSLFNWEKSFPTTLYAHWKDISSLMQEITVFNNEPQDGGFSGQRTATVKLDKEIKSAIKSNSNAKIKIEYSIDLEIDSTWEPSPIAMYIKGYENSGAERYEIFTHTPTVGTFKTFTGSVEIDATDFIDGNVYIVLWNTKKQNGSWKYPIYYSRNLIFKISIIVN